MSLNLKVRLFFYTGFLLTALLCLTPSIAKNDSESQLSKPQQKDDLLSSTELVKSVELDSFDWAGKIPSSRQVIVRNPYGSISSRNHSEKKVLLHATIQKIGKHKLKPKFDIREEGNQLFIDLVYSESIFDEGGNFKARTDIAILFPDYVNLYAQTDFGMIKIDKTASSVSAYTNSGKIKLATTGLFHTESINGDIELKLRGIKMKGTAVAQSDSGMISVELFNDMDLFMRAESSAKIITNGKALAEKHFNLTQGEKLSNVQISSNSGDISINVIEPPALVKSVKPSMQSIDLRQLPVAKLWQPGEPVIERDDRRNNRHNK